MLRYLAVLLAVALLCAYLAPNNTLRESALQALDSSLLCSLGGFDTEETDVEEEAAAPFQRRREGREVSSRPVASMSMKRRRVTPFISNKMAARQKLKCAMCGKLLQEDWEVDHIVSLQRGGSNDLNNLQALHKRCHAYKNHIEQPRTDPRDK